MNGAGDRPQWLEGRHYAGLALVCAAGVAYGSLVPLHYTPLPWGVAVGRFREVCAAGVRLGSRSDWAANVLLMLPLGYLLAAALSVDRHWAAGLAVAPLVVALCAGLSVGVEFAQLYFPPRVCSLNDIAAQTAGAALGAAGWLALGAWATAGARRWWADASGGTFAARLLPAYVAGLVLLEVMPFDLSLSPVEVVRKWRRGLVRPVPFVLAAGRTPLDMAEKEMLNAALYLPAGLLLAGLPGQGWRRGERALGAGLALAAFVEGCQLLAASHSFDATDVVVGGVSVLGGWALGEAARRGRPGGAGRWLLAACLVAWLAGVAGLNWRPFDFHLDAGLAWERLRQVTPTPFADYWEGNYLKFVWQAVTRTLLFVPVGAFLGLLGRGAGAAAVTAGVGLALGVEAGQLLLPTRYPGVTDVLVAGVGTWVGFGIERQLQGAGAFTERDPVGCKFLETGGPVPL